MKQTKHSMVLNYLTENDFGKTHGITSLEAISLFGATRLSAIIFNLKKSGINVVSNTEESLDRFGNTVRYSRYKVIPTKAE